MVYSSYAVALSVIRPEESPMPAVVKKALPRKSQRRVALTVRLSQVTLKNIERVAPKKDGVRTFIREHLEQQFGI
jgi:hypothetical protein